MKELECLSEWIIEQDKERECFRILTKENIIFESPDEPPEQQWIGDIYEFEDAQSIVYLHNLLVNQIIEAKNQKELER